jgi:hypothetical protein
MVPGIMRSEQNLVNDDRPLHPVVVDRHFETRKQRGHQRVVGLARKLDGAIESLFTASVDADDVQFWIDDPVLQNAWHNLRAGRRCNAGREAGPLGDAGG